MGTSQNIKLHKAVGWLLLCVSLAAFFFLVHRATPHLSFALSVGLSSTFFGLLFLLEDKLMFSFRRSLFVFGLGFFVGTFIRSMF
jgi:hypothetical protein